MHEKISEVLVERGLSWIISAMIHAWGGTTKKAIILFKRYINGERKDSSTVSESMFDGNLEERILFEIRSFELYEEYDPITSQQIITKIRQELKQS